jgi:hypothetical protein
MQFEIRSEDLRKLGRDLRGQDNKHLRSKFTKAVREPLKGAQREVRVKIRAIPSKGAVTGGHAARHGHKLKEGAKRSQRFGTLRSRLAATVAIKVNMQRNVSVRIYMDASKLPEGQRGLPQLMEGVRPWRHPVFGHDVWVSQQAHPYFFTTVLPYRRQVQEELLRAADEVIRELVQGKQGN